MVMVTVMMMMMMYGDNIDFDGDGDDYASRSMTGFGNKYDGADDVDTDAHNYTVTAETMHIKKLHVLIHGINVGQVRNAEEQAGHSERHRLVFLSSLRDDCIGLHRSFHL